MEQLLFIFRNDLGLSSTSKDEYFIKFLLSSKNELEEKGIVLNLDDSKNIDDLMLISDYAAWKYRNRSDNVTMPSNLLWRIRNRIVKARSNYGIL